jgi:hypothetical protein
MGTGADFPRVKRPGLEAYHYPPSSAEIKNNDTIPPLPHMFPWNSAQLITQVDNLTLSINITSINVRARGSVVG